MSDFIKSGDYLLFYVYILCLFFNNGVAWVQEELDLFDLVDEIKENFYDILKVEQSASASEIKKAYRRLSMQLHPDRNKEENAEEQFRKLVQVYDVLKEDHKRLRYNEILRNGLPDWRQPVFYYRRMRKMALWEMMIFLLLLLTSGQYLVMWSIYWEKKFELEELLTSKKKRTEKKLRKQKLLVEDSSTQEMFHEEFSAIPRPQLINLLICRLITFSFETAKNSPKYMMHLRELMKKPPPVVEEEEEEEEKAQKKLKKKIKIVQEVHEYPISDDGTPISSAVNGSLKNSKILHTKEFPDRKGLEWSDEDVCLLAKAMTKFPGGIPERWEKIATVLGRSVTEVTQMAKRVKTSSYDVGTVISKDEKNADSFHLIENISTEESTTKRPRPTKNTKTADRTLMIRQQEFPTAKENKNSQGEPWSKSQQKSLEQALSQYPKGTADRWDVIAEHVPDKSKEECILRYKELVELVKQKKQAAS